jgi:inorganic phosphate transporter, PiT family
MLILILVVVTAVCFDFTNFHGILKSVIAPAILSPIICFIVAGVGTFAVYRLIRYLKEGEARRGYRYG